MKPPQDIPGVGRFAVVADPQGAVFNLSTAPTPGHLAPLGESGRVGWQELHTRDWNQAWNFYQGLYGWQKSAASQMASLGTYQTFAIGGVPQGGMFNSPGAQPAW